MAHPAPTTVRIDAATLAALDAVLVYPETRSKAIITAITREIAARRAVVMVPVDVRIHAAMVRV
jgi:hypothetical protein